MKTKNITIGLVLIAIGVALGLFTHMHRPIQGVGDALMRMKWNEEQWVLKPEFYYSLLFVSSLFGLGGILRIFRGLKPNA